jgi:hypothetical protein
MEFFLTCKALGISKQAALSFSARERHRTAKIAIKELETQNTEFGIKLAAGTRCEDVKGD